MLKFCTVTFETVGENADTVCLRLDLAVSLRAVLNWLVVVVVLDKWLQGAKGPTGLVKPGGVLPWSCKRISHHIARVQVNLA